MTLDQLDIEDWIQFGQLCGPQDEVVGSIPVGCLFVCLENQLLYLFIWLHYNYSMEIN